MTSTTLEKTTETTFSPTAFPETAPTAQSQAFTLEHLLWLLLALIALGMRLIGLTYWPLSESEATLAYEAWQFAGGESYQMSAELVSPFAFNLAGLFFALFSASDLTARMAQVFGGTALVLAPWFLRPLLGRGQALAMSTLLLLSPSVLFWSRQASGEIWAALCALLLIAGLARWCSWGKQSDGVLAALALGVGLTTAPGFWSVLIAGGLFLLWQWRTIWARLPALREMERGIEIPLEVVPNTESDDQLSGPEPKAKKHLSNGKEKQDTQDAPINRPPSSAKNQETELIMRRKQAVKRAALGYGTIAFTAFVLTATAFFTNLQGLGAAFNLPAQWLLAIFGVGPSLTLPFFFVVLLYEVLPLLMGLVGGVRMISRQPLWAWFGFLWVAVTLIPAALTNSGSAASLLFVTLPLTLLASKQVANLIQSVFEEWSWMIDGLLILLGMGLLIYFWINLASYIRDPQPFKIVSLLIPPGAWLITALVLSSTYQRSDVRRGMGAMVLILLTFISFTNSWGVTIIRPADPREPLVVQPTSLNLPIVAKQLTQISIERYRHPAKIPVGIQRTLGYAPRWYLRHFESVTLVDGSHAGLPEATLLDSELPPPDLAEIGQRVWISSSWQWPISDTLGFLRWLKTREEAAGIIERTAVLYVMLP